MLLALWLVVYAIMHLINFSFLVVLFGFMQLENYKLSWFLQRGAFPLYPTQNGLIFMPLTFELPLSPQLQEVDIVLHKATDEIISIELESNTNFSNRIVCTCGMRDLQRWLFRSIKLYVSRSGMNWVIKEKMNVPMPVFVFLCLASREALSFIFFVELFCDYANMNLVKLWSWPKWNVRLVNEPNKNTVIICKSIYSFDSSKCMETSLNLWTINIQNIFPCNLL